MNVKLVSFSKPSRQHASEGLHNCQDLVAYCARVSNPSNQFNTETSTKLLDYLIKHKHWSPFEMVSVCLEISTTRDIARQILRHRSFSFQEFSQRYADPIKEFSFEFRGARMQDPKNRQNSIPLNGTLGQAILEDEWVEKQREVIKKTKEVYKWALDKGIAKECARAVLPEGLTSSIMLVNGTLRSWIHYIEVRTKNGTQKEHELIAKECAVVIAEVFPLIQQEQQEK